MVIQKLNSIRDIETLKEFANKRDSKYVANSLSVWIYPHRVESSE